MGVYQDKKSKRWYFEAMIRGKRYHQAIPEATNRRDAETYFNAFKTDLLRGKLDLVENIGCKPFKELVKVYVEYSKTNHRSYKTNVAKAYKFEKLWGNRQLKDISPMDIEKYKINRKKEIKVKEKIIDGVKIPAKYISNTTINRDIEVLRKMFNLAIQNGWLTKNPCTGITKLRQENKLERYLTPDEEIRLIEACVGRFEYMKPIIQFALNTGMRKEEILSLTWKCVNFDNNKITLLDTKNGKKRFIPINSVVRSVLKDAHKKKCCDYVFANPITKTRYADLKRSFVSLCEKANVENFRFHDLRHTSATRMVGAGVPITMVNQNNAFTKALNKEIYNILKIDPTEELLTDVTYDSKYVSRMFAGVSDSNFRMNFNKLINMIKENPNRKFTDIIQEIPENIETRKLFEENGLDFDKWIKFNEDSYEPFVVTVDVDKSVRSAKQNLKNELNSELAKRLDQNQIAKINQILVENGFETAGQKDLPKIIKLIEKELDTGEYWKQDTPEIKTFKDHIQIHKKNIHDVEQLKDATEELHVRLWDKDDVGRNIFFGNHVGCCTSVGSFNSFAAPQHLMNAFVNGIEIVDKAGNSMGNSMCYFAKVDGKLTFIIDSFEANGKLGAAPEVTNAIIEYAKKVCAEMGQPDANVMFGPNYNKIDFSRCIRTNGHTIEVIGRAPENTYIDCIGGRGNINSVVSGRDMHEIMDL